MTAKKTTPPAAEPLGQHPDQPLPQIEPAILDDKTALASGGPDKSDQKDRYVESMAHDTPRELVQDEVQTEGKDREDRATMQEGSAGPLDEQHPSVTPPSVDKPAEPGVTPNDEPETITIPSTGKLKDEVLETTPAQPDVDKREDHVKASQEYRKLQKENAKEAKRTPAAESTEPKPEPVGSIVLGGKKVPLLSISHPQYEVNGAVHSVSTTDKDGQLVTLGGIPAALIKRKK